jgi:hypothetical protein
MTGSRESDDNGDDLAALVQRVVVDLAILAPIGFVKKARTLIPELVNEGRSTVASAQVIGKFVTPILRKQGTKLVKETIRPTPKPTSPKHTSQKAPSSTDSATAAASTEDAAADAASVAEPFAGYDHLGSAAVVARLGELSAAQRRAVRVYETANRNRRTILGRLDQLDPR